MYKRVTRKQCAVARQRATTIIQNVQKLLRDKYIFAPRLVDSGAWGTMVEDENGEYDLDYQLLLTLNSPIYNKETKAFPPPTEIKQDFLTAFERVKKSNEVFQNSTTAITLINNDGKPYHIALLLLKLCRIMILLFEETIKEKRLNIMSLLGMNCRNGMTLINILKSYRQKKNSI